MFSQTLPKLKSTKAQLSLPSSNNQKVSPKPAFECDLKGVDDVETL